MNVWNLSQQMQQVDEAIDRAASMNEGEVPELLLEFFERLTTEFALCSEPVAAVIRKKSAEAKMLREQAKRFDAEAAKLESFVVRTKECVMVAMDAMGEKKNGSFSVCKNGGKAPLIIDETENPQDHLDLSKVEVSWDSAAIRKQLDSNKILPFAKYGERGKHVRVKGAAK